MRGGTGEDEIDAGDGSDIVASGPRSDVVDLGEGDDVLDGGTGGPRARLRGRRRDGLLGVPRLARRLWRQHRTLFAFEKISQRMQNCEIVVTADPTAGGLTPRRDVSAAWANAGLRTGDLATARRGSLADAPQAGTRRRTVYRLTAGNDTADVMRLDQAYFGPVLILAGVGDDVVRGGIHNDHLEGEAGDDLLDGWAGDDLLFGRTGDDLLLGREGDDVLEGGRGADTLKGGDGEDRLTGGFDRDRMSAGAGNDHIVSVDGKRDTVDCGAGRDVATVDRRDSVRRNCERVIRD